MASDKIVVLTKDNFEELVTASDKPVLVDFWASWCGPCRAVAPVMEEIADEYDGKAVIGKVNVDNEGDLSAKFRIISIPTVMLFKGGQVVDKVEQQVAVDEHRDGLAHSLVHEWRRRVGAEVKEPADAALEDGRCQEDQTGLLVLCREDVFLLEVVGRQPSTY